VIATLAALQAERGPVALREAATRRDLLLALISKSPVGLTAVDLRQQTPKLKGPDRSNALAQLKTAGAIRRAGNTWVLAK
jgi:hypothetical protein